MHPAVNNVIACLVWQSEDKGQHYSERIWPSDVLIQPIIASFQIWYLPLCASRWSTSRVCCLYVSGQTKQTPWEWRGGPVSFRVTSVTTQHSAACKHRCTCHFVFHWHDHIRVSNRQVIIYKVYLQRCDDTENMNLISGWWATHVRARGEDNKSPLCALIFIIP